MISLNLQDMLSYLLQTSVTESYAIPNQEASTLAHALVTNSFCRFEEPRELRSD
jgi:hypothetical protein